MVNPLSHDAFIVLSELESLGNQCTRELLTEAVHKRGIKGLDTLILELVKANQVIEDNYRQLIIACFDKRDKLSPQKTLSYKEAFNSKAIISSAVKGMHAGYQAVVAGKKPRYSPIHEYAKQLSRVDLPKYWELVRRMTHAERSRFSASVARLLD